MTARAAILIVEGSPTQSLLLKCTLAQHGFDVYTARNGVEALGLLEQAEPDLIITAAEMPQMGGYELCQKVRSDERFAKIPIVLLTSLSDPAEIARGMECGADSFLKKPCEDESLLSKIESILAERGTRGAFSAAETSDRTGAVLSAERRLRILLAEDSRVNQMVAIKLLEKNGHSVVLAENGVEAVAASSAQPFDVILMDVEMPEMDGLKATALIREKERERGGHICILAMTAHTQQEDFELCDRAGMDGRLSKPLDLQEFLQAYDEVAISRATER